MEEYKFECINQTKLAFLMLTIPIVFLGVFYIINSTEDNVYLVILIPLIVSFLFYWFIENTAKIRCIIRISEQKIEIEKVEKLEIVNFDQILSYKIQPKKFVLLNLKNKKRSKISINSSVFYASNVFEDYCFDLENAIDDYNNKYDAGIKRESLLFEKKWILSFLIFISLVFITALGVIVSQYKKIELWIFIFPLLALWAGYFDQRNRK